MCVIANGPNEKICERHSLWKKKDDDNEEENEEDIESFGDSSEVGEEVEGDLAVFFKFFTSGGA